MKKNRFIKRALAIFIIVILIAIVISIILKYNVEGEKNMPFQISKVMLISTANGIEKEVKMNGWDIDVAQNSDIYIDIIKNKNYLSEEIIDKVIIDNINVEEKPQKGEIKLYRPTGEDGNFNSNEEYKIKEELIYTGSETSDIKNLKIPNQGGLILIRSVNENIGRYVSNGEQTIKYDGTILSKIGVSNEEIKYKISFDVSIELKSEKIYKTTINLEIPNGNLTENGTTSYQLNGENIIFKRY